MSDFYKAIALKVLSNLEQAGESVHSDLEDNDGDMYEFLLPKIAERESLTVTGVVSPPTPE